MFSAARWNETTHGCITLEIEALPVVPENAAVLRLH